MLQVFRKMSHSLVDKEQVSVHDDGDLFVIRYRWFTPTAVNTVIIPGVLIGIPCIVAVLGVAPIRGLSGWAAVALVVTIWVAATYCYLAKLFNSTWITIDRGTISVHHSPIPWRPGPTLDGSRIEGIVPRQRFETQIDEGCTSVTSTFEVVAIEGDSELPLLSRLYDVSIAANIAGHASRQLGLVRAGDNTE